MRYSELEHLCDDEFKRLCGVSRNMFVQMVEVVRPHLERRGIGSSCGRYYLLE